MVVEDKDETTKLRCFCIEFLDGVLAKIDSFGDGVYVMENERLVSLNI